MGSVSIQVLPTIEFTESAGLSPGSPVWNSVKSQVHEALVKYGCLVACFENFELELEKSTTEALEELFDLPLQTKLKNTSTTPYYGYTGQGPRLRLFESMGIEDPVVLQNTQTFTNLMWPEGNPTFSKTIQLVSKKASELNEIVRKMVLESLGVEKYFDEHINSTEYLLRMMKYKAPETTEPIPATKTHTDKSILTILYQDQTAGLQVRTPDGNWIDVKPSPVSFIVMIGDAFSAWTNGRFHSPYHRVMMRGNEARYSLGFFAIPKAGYIIKAPEELVDKEYPLLFKPYDHHEFISFYYTAAGQKAESALAAYCGVN